MKITCLVENTSHTKLTPVHGLSFYIETKNHKILFDVGPDDTIFKNAKLLNIDLSKVDIVIISHGHKDHGGALQSFLNINHTAKIYIQDSAFRYHSNLSPVEHSISIDNSLKNHPQVILLDGNHQINDELSLFIVKTKDIYHSVFNDALLEDNEMDKFEHEQNLIIKDSKTVLIMGCGHKGIVNIMANASCDVDYCIGGYHLYNRRTKKTVDSSLLDDIANELNKYKNTKFYTCHCTGEAAYIYLKQKMTSLEYISCGDILKIE